METTVSGMILNIRSEAWQDALSGTWSAIASVQGSDAEVGGSVRAVFQLLMSWRRTQTAAEQVVDDGFWRLMIDQVAQTTASCAATCIHSLIERELHVATSTACAPLLAAAPDGKVVSAADWEEMGRRIDTLRVRLEELHVELRIIAEAKVVAVSTLLGLALGEVQRLMLEHPSIHLATVNALHTCLQFDTPFGGEALTLKDHDDTVEWLRDCLAHAGVDLTVLNAHAWLHRAAGSAVWAYALVCREGSRSLLTQAQAVVRRLKPVFQAIHRLGRTTHAYTCQLVIVEKSDLDAWIEGCEDGVGAMSKLMCRLHGISWLWSDQVLMEQLEWWSDALGALCRAMAGQYRHGGYPQQLPVAAALHELAHSACISTNHLTSASELPSTATICSQIKPQSVATSAWHIREVGALRQMLTDTSLPTDAASATHWNQTIAAVRMYITRLSADIASGRVVDEVDLRTAATKLLHLLVAVAGGTSSATRHQLEACLVVPSVAPMTGQDIYNSLLEVKDGPTGCLSPSGFAASVAWRITSESEGPIAGPASSTPDGTNETTALLSDWRDLFSILKQPSATPQCLCGWQSAVLHATAFHLLPASLDASELRRCRRLLASCRTLATLLTSAACLRIGDIHKAIDGAAEYVAGVHLTRQSDMLAAVQHAHDEMLSVALDWFRLVAAGNLFGLAARESLAVFNARHVCEDALDAAEHAAKAVRQGAALDIAALVRIAGGCGGDSAASTLVAQLTESLHRALRDLELKNFEMVRRWEATFNRLQVVQAPVDAKSAPEIWMQFGSFEMYLKHQLAERGSASLDG